MARVKGVKEPLVKTAMLRRPLAVIQIQDEKAGDQNWHRAAQGIRQGAHRTQGAHAAQPCHAAVQHRRHAKGNVFAQAGVFGPGKQQRKHRGQQCPITEDGRKNQQYNAKHTQKAAVNLFLRGQHQKAEQQRKQHVKLEHARHAVLGEDQLVGQLRQHRKPKKPPGVLGFGVGVAVAFHEEIAHGHGSKIADVQAKIRQRCPGGHKHIGDVVYQHRRHGKHFDGITIHCISRSCKFAAPAAVGDI